MTKQFFKAALIRAVRTVAQTAIATISTAAVLAEVDWMIVLSASALAGILSILNSIATGLPEVDADTGRVTVRAYDEYDEDGNPVVQGECAACDLSDYLEDGDRK